MAFCLDGEHIYAGCYCLFLKISVTFCNNDIENPKSKLKLFYMRLSGMTWTFKFTIVYELKLSNLSLQSIKTQSYILNINESIAVFIIFVWFFCINFFKYFSFFVLCNI